MYLVISSAEKKLDDGVGVVELAGHSVHEGEQRLDDLGVPATPDRRLDFDAAAEDRALAGKNHPVASTRFSTVLARGTCSPVNGLSVHCENGDVASVLVELGGELLVQVLFAQLLGDPVRARVAHFPII